MQPLIIQEKFNYLLADRQFYEPLSRYPARTQDLHDPLRRILPKNWTLEQRNLWSDVVPPDLKIAEYGWKIHVSATPAHAPAILLTVARILIEAGVSFKFISDRMLLTMVNGKRWSRGGAGKFITVYPRDTAECGDLLEKLHQATIGYWGPYILSDRRYKNSRIVHYRYGGFVPIKRADVDGKAILVIRNDAGEFVDDERTPYFNLPDGMVDPFECGQDAEDDGEVGVLKGGRYRVESPIAFSNSGGVYLARDSDNTRQVLIKEGRPFTNISSRGLDAVQLLKKEHRLLEVVADLGIAPRPYDFFIDWEHAYLVEEYLEDYVTLRHHLSRISLSLLTRPGTDESRTFYEKYCALFARLASIIGDLHQRNIIFSDLSMANVMVREGDDGTLDVKLIDFEGAYEEGVDVPTHLFTPGYSTDEMLARGMAQREDDRYALGSLMMAGLFPMNSLLTLNRNAHESYLAAFQQDFDLPRPIAGIIRRLMSENGADRPDPDEVKAVLVADYAPGPPRIGTSEVDDVDLRQVISRMLAYIDSVASFERSDRLYPADPEVFETNPLSIAHGACGVAYVMHRVRGQVDAKVIDWIRAHHIRREGYSPGLYTGLSGVAWSLLEMGQEGDAVRILDMTHDHHLLWRSPELFNGASGWGMAQLKFHSTLGRPVYLENARRVGDFLLGNRRYDEESGRGCNWEGTSGLSASLGHGAAGVALFLLYLHQATADERYLEAGREALDWVLDRAYINADGGMSWIARESNKTYTPYWRWGSSGIGQVLLRYWHIGGEERYADAIDKIQIDCDRKYTIFPGYFFGISGIGELCMDLARFPRWEGQALASIRRILAGAMLFPFERDGGLAFPGESLSRISCDFGTGSAGIALVMNRYLERDGASFMLDELLPGWSLEDRCESTPQSREAAWG